MKTVASLITDVRTITRNVANQDGTFSIANAEIVRYLNDAQMKVQNKLSAAKNIAKIFVTEEEISIVANQAEYSITNRVLLNKQIEMVEFSATGNAGDYTQLEKLNFFNRDTNTSTSPWGYFKRGNQIILQPTPSAATGTIRVSYEEQLDDLAVVTDTVSGTPAGTTITVTTGGAGLFAGQDYICIRDVDGVLLLKNGLVSSYTSPTITLAANVSTYLHGTAVLADLASENITIGKFSTTLSALPDACEPFLIHYAAAQVFHKDSSGDYNKENRIAQDILDDILDAFSSQTGEIQYIPQTQRFEWW